MANTFTCPTCNTTHSVTPVRAGGVVGVERGGGGVPYKKQEMRTNRFGDGPSKTVTQSVRSVPLSNARPSFDSSFRTPLAISAVTGGLAVAGALLVFTEEVVELIKHRLIHN